MNHIESNREDERGSNVQPRPEWYLGVAARVVYLLTSIVGLALAGIELWERLQ